MASELKWLWTTCNCLLLYLSVYVTRQLFWHEMPPLRTHVLTWSIIAVWVTVTAAFTHRRRVR